MQASSQYGIELTSSKLPSLDLAFPTGNRTRTRTERLSASRCLAIERTVVCTRIPQPRARLGPGLPTKQGRRGKSAARRTSLAGSQSKWVVCSVEYNEATTGSYCFTSFRPQTREMPSTTKSHGAIGTDWARIIMTASSHLSRYLKDWVHAGRTALGLMHPFSKEKARPLGRSDLDASDRHPLRSKIAIVMAGQDVSRSCDFSCPALFSALIDVVRTLSSSAGPGRLRYGTHKLLKRHGCKSLHAR